MGTRLAAAMTLLVASVVAFRVAGAEAQAGTAAGGSPRVLQEGMWGEDVFRLQLALQELGLKVMDVTGYFGPATKAAVQRLQQAVGLQPDGVVGPATRRVLEGLQRPYRHRVQPGDNLWDLARRFATTMESLMDANDLTTTTLRPGQELVIPSVRLLYVPAATRLANLARRWGVPLRPLLELNNLKEASVVAAGSEIWVPLPRF